MEIETIKIGPREREFDRLMMVARVEAGMDEYIQIKFQEGPIREVGVNGAQVDDVIQVCEEKLQACQEALPCRETALAITKLQECLHWLTARSADRLGRGVEGTSEA